MNLGLGGRYVGSVKREPDIYKFIKSDLCIYVKRELYVYMEKEYLHPYISTEIRQLCQKRPIYIWKETYKKKSDLYEWKEAYVYT